MQEALFEGNVGEAQPNIIKHSKKENFCGGHGNLLD